MGERMLVPLFGAPHVEQSGAKRVRDSATWLRMVYMHSLNCYISSRRVYMLHILNPRQHLTSKRQIPRGGVEVHSLGAVGLVEARDLVAKLVPGLWQTTSCRVCTWFHTQISLAAWSCSPVPFRRNTRRIGRSFCPNPDPHGKSTA